MNLNLRLETPEDYHTVEELTREAFWGFMRPTCDELKVIVNGINNSNKHGAGGKE